MSLDRHGKLNGVDARPVYEDREIVATFAVGDIVVEGTGPDKGSLKVAEHGESGRIVGLIAQVYPGGRKARVYTGRRIVATAHPGSAVTAGEYVYVASANTFGGADEVPPGARCVGRCHERRGEALYLDLCGIEAFRPGPDAG